MKFPCIYIVASRRNGTIYVGVTSNLPSRISAHKQRLMPGFTRKHGCERLVYYECFATMDDAILREKRLKEWQRNWKLRLIEQANPEWEDLFDLATGIVLELPVDRDRPSS